MELNIKNMVCDRCIASVRDVLEELDLEVEEVELGRAEINGSPPDDRLEDLHERLREKGFELIRDEGSVLVERIRNEILSYLGLLETETDPPSLSEYLASQLHFNYSYLSHTFSEATGSTIEQHLIRLKIERVKELLTYGEHTLTEIAWRLNYSSVQYLSNQFKKVTGMTVSEFRSADGPARRDTLNSLR